MTYIQYITQFSKKKKKKTNIYQLHSNNIYQLYNTSTPHTRSWRIQGHTFNFPYLITYQCVIFKAICEISGFSNDEDKAFTLLDVTLRSLVAGSWQLAVGSWQLVPIRQPTLRSIQQDRNVK